MFENTESGLMTDEGMRIEDFNKAYEAAPVAPEPEQGDSTGKWDLRGRLRSKVLWVAVIGGVIQIFSGLNLWAKLGITVEGFREVMIGVGAILEAFGVFNDPTSRGRF